MSNAFIISAGRSGSTLLSQMLHQHAGVCSISEFWTCLFMQGFGNPTLGGEEFWKLLEEPPNWFKNFIEKARAAERIPSEIAYDESLGRYLLEECPPILTMTLPNLTVEPDRVFDILKKRIPNWDRAPLSCHASQLFEELRDHFHREIWVERSGLSYWYVPDLAAGFPDAHYVHLTRDGREVILSMMEMRLFDPIVRLTWMINSAQSDLWPLSDWMFFKKRELSRRFMLGFSDFERAIFRQHRRERPYSLPSRFDFSRQAKEYARFWATSVDLGLRSMSAIRPEKIFTLRYEDLVENPRESLSRLAVFLKIDPNYDNWIDLVIKYPRRQRCRWSSLEPTLANELEKIISPINSRMGY